MLAIFSFVFKSISNSGPEMNDTMNQFHGDFNFQWCMCVCMLIYVYRIHIN